MDSKQPVPKSLKIVAGLFILGGLCSVIEVVISLMHNVIDYNLGVLGLFIGLGLLRFSRFWRICALVFLWVLLIGVPVIAVLFMTHHGPLALTFLGQNIGHISRKLGLFLAGAVFLLTLWQYRVLIRPDIRKLFGIGNG